jgi:hypothetical protein
MRSFSTTGCVLLATALTTAVNLEPLSAVPADVSISERPAETERSTIETSNVSIHDRDVLTNSLRWCVDAGLFRSAILGLHATTATRD